MFRTSNFDKNLENATSHLRLEPDWPSILLICDAIRQNDVSAKYAFQAIKKKMMSPNPHSSCYSLLVLESAVKNCGAPMHEEISTKESCEMFSSFIEQTPHENVRQKMLELIQTWAYAFRTSEKYQAIKDTMTILKAKGHTFPELKEADAMFTADTAPDWADGKVCHRCRVEFTFTQRKHHCRNCGQIFCAQCSSKQCPLPKFGIEKDVRVCDGCFTQLQKPTSGKPKSAESDLPAEYLNSSLAQQSQTPPRKTEQELKEEEELQLALALSQSEAEQKSKQPVNYRYIQRSPSPEAPPAPPVVVTATSQVSIEETPSDPELAKYLDRSYWEQRKTTESPASPSAPSPMLSINNSIISTKISTEDAEIDDFGNYMKTQVEIFVNRMKSNSSRGRSISNDSSVEKLFMNLTTLHSRLLTYIKEMDDKRMWYEQLQDKLAQVKDSRAALDVLRQEHIEKLRRIAEEQERQRQLQMAHKLEIMRKKKQEYLQYQRQLALQRIQEQEREMQLRQEQQKAQYRMGQSAFPFMGQQGSPNHQIPSAYGNYGYNPNTGNIPRFGPQNSVAPPHSQANMPPVPMPGMYTPGISPLPNQPNVVPSGQMQGIPQNQGAAPNIAIQQNSGQPVQQMNMPVSHHQPPTNVPTSVQTSFTQPSTIGQQPIPSGLIQQGQEFIQGQQQQIAPGSIASNNTTMVNSAMQNVSQMPTTTQQIRSNPVAPPPPQPPIVNQQQGQTGIATGQTQNIHSMEHKGNEPNISANNQDIKTSPKQSTEEDNEVTTAELISFD